MVGSVVDIMGRFRRDEWFVLVSQPELDVRHSDHIWAMLRHRVLREQVPLPIRIFAVELTIAAPGGGGAGSRS